MKKYLFISIILSWVCSFSVFSQSLSINTDGSTANASAMLDVKSTVKGLLIPRMTTAQRTAIATPATGLQVYDTDLNLVYFYNGSTWAGLSASTNFWTLSAGNIYNNTGAKVGIGTNNPSAKLHVGAGTRFTVLDTGSVFLQSGNTIGSARDWKMYVSLPNGYLSFRDMGFDNLNNGMASDAMVIVWGSGNVGIGTQTPSSKLEVCGDVRVIGTIVASGSITTSAITCPSDFRYKKDITPLSNSLQKLMRMEGVNYYWKTSDFPAMNFNNKMQMGFIAQDVEKIFPEMVFTDDAGYKSIDYSRLTPVLVETIKDQQKQINELFKRVETLEKNKH